MQEQDLRNQLPTIQRIATGQLKKGDETTIQAIAAFAADQLSTDPLADHRKQALAKTSQAVGSVTMSVFRACCLLVAILCFFGGFLFWPAWIVGITAFVLGLTVTKVR